MLKKKKCPNCNEKVTKSTNFCPNCGIQLREIQQDWGMLGARDEIPGIDKTNLIDGLSGGILNKMLNGAIKMLEKEMQKEIANNQPKTKIKLLINGKEINPQNQKKQSNQKENERKLPIEFSEENLKKWISSQKQEPKSTLKRIDDKIQYELEVPGVETIKDISILKLEESLEVRAIAKEKAYQKKIPINLPLKKYSLLKDKLTLELDASL